jgi:hypothetical protein
MPAKSKAPTRYNPITYRYGFALEDIHAAAKLIRPLLKVRWKRLSDPFWGGDHYLLTRKNGVIIKLHHNYEAHFDHWLQPGYRQYPILLMMQYPANVKAPDAQALLAQFSTVITTVQIPPNDDIWDTFDQPMQEPTA